MRNNAFRVIWEDTALRGLGKLYNVDHDNVYFRSKWLLSQSPRKKADGIAQYPGLEHNGYYWILVHNVIILYDVSDEKKEVTVDACYFANTERSHEIFWEIDPDDE